MYFKKRTSIWLASCILIFAEFQHVKAVNWQRVQIWRSKQCVDTTMVKSWKDNQREVTAMEYYFGNKKTFISVAGNKAEAVELKIDGRRIVVAEGYIDKKEVVLYSGKKNSRSIGRIMRKTDKLLFISSEPGRVEVYQNTSAPRDSVPLSMINKLIVESGAFFGKNIQYCK